MTARQNLPARSEDIDRCQMLLGSQFPQWLVDSLCQHNGHDIDDRAGATGTYWRFLPVLDRTSVSC